MIEPVQSLEDRRLPITPQLALRIALMGGIALILFGIVFFRLWYLQVLTGDQYVQQANANRVRNIRVQAPRGDIVDRNGIPVVTSRAATAVQVVPDALPASEPQRRLIYGRLGHVLQMSPGRIEREVSRQHHVLPYANVTIKTDAGRAVLDYLAERQDEFGGAVQTPQVFLRSYPLHELGAQLLGTVGEINAQELTLPRFRGVTQGTVIGKSGVEWSYDHYLRGRDGAQRVQVNAFGAPAGQLSTVAPIPGRQLKLSLDTALQREGQAAIQQGIGLAQANGHSAARAGAFVALDPSNGQVLALGSYPSFDPSVFAKPISKAKYDALSSQAHGAPLYDRAIAGLYPTGSTFKPITAMAALQSGLITSQTPINSPGCIGIGAANQQFCSSGKADYGTLTLRDALKVSSDVFFYILGEEANSRGEIIQQWAHRLGLGQPTGIDLPDEVGGLIPDHAWRARVGREEAQCRARRHVPSCGISDERPWSVGDNVNLAVGQGDVQATPLQMAEAYSTIVNGGRVVRPHIGMEVDDSLGRLIQRIDPAPARHVSFSQSNQQVIMDGLHAAATEQGGTSADVFAGFPHVVYGKTGTAQRAGQDDQSWYICYAPDARRPIVLAVTIEQGGFGAQAAAPAARLMLSEWFHLPKKLVAGHSTTL